MKLKNTAAKILVYVSVLTGFFVFSDRVSMPAFAQSTDSQSRLTLQKIKVFDGFHKGFFSPDGTKLALMGERKVKIVSFPAGKEICQTDIPSASGLFSSPFLPDGKTVAVNYTTFNYQARKGTHQILLLNGSTCGQNKILFSQASGYGGSYLSFTADEKVIATSIGDAPRILDLTNGQEVYKDSFRQDFHAGNVLISPDGNWLASYSQAFRPPDSNGSFDIVDLKTNEKKTLNEDLVLDFKFAANSSLLIVTSSVFKEDHLSTRINMKIYEVGSWKLKQTIFDTTAINAVAISPDKTLAAGGGNGKFRIFSLSSGKLLTEEYHYKRTKKDDDEKVPQLVSFLTQIEFSPDGKTLLTGGEDGTVKLWNINKWIMYLPVK